jgi:hypothetical protein
MTMRTCKPPFNPGLSNLLGTATVGAALYSSWLCDLGRRFSNLPTLTAVGLAWRASQALFQPPPSAIFVTRAFSARFSPVATR